MSNKRSNSQLSPEQLFNNQNKKQNTETVQSKQIQQNMNNSQNSAAADAFSWNKLCNLLDDKLKDVAKKEDVLSIKKEIDELREENVVLRNEVKMLSSRIEQIDRRSRLTNIVVSGMASANATAAKLDFINLCTNNLNVNANVVTVRALPSKGTFVFTLETYLQANNILAAKDKLKGGTIYIQKDYTKEEQNTRYNLRQLNKKISNLNLNIKVRLGEFCTFINNKKYSWMPGKFVAYSNEDADYLKNLLVQANYSMDVIVKVNIAAISNANNNVYANEQ